MAALFACTVPKGSGGDGTVHPLLGHPPPNGVLVLVSVGEVLLAAPQVGLASGGGGQ